MPKVVDISPEDLRRLYEEEEHSAVEIARIYSCSPTTINNKLRKFGIPVRTIEEATRLQCRVEIPKDELRRLYCDEERSTYDIAEIYACNAETVRNRLLEYGIPIRSMSEALLAQRGVTIPCDELRRLYEEEELSTYAIAEQSGCSPSAVYNHLLLCDIQPRSWRESVTRHPKRDFDGEPIEKAYLIGFRLGDLHVSKMGEDGKVIRVACTSTKREQFDLFRQLFHHFGFIWEGKPKRTGHREFVVYLNLSFEFLLPKRDQIEPWIMADEDCFAAFWAGYVDAEGCFTVTQHNIAQFKVSSYDKNILHQAWAKLKALGIDFPRLRLKRSKGTADKHGIVNRKDVWELDTGKKATILQLCDLLDPYLKHAKRRRDMERARQNVIERNRKNRNRPQ